MKLAPALRCLCSLLLVAAAPVRPPADASTDDLLDWVEHGYAQNDDVRLHYVSLGEGPLVIMLHGFPDYWYTWRHQMQALAENFHVVAMDLRGYNRSDKPEGVDQYAMPHLVSDVEAVIRANDAERAIVIGHDWGAAIAWQFAMNRPAMVERLVILSVPHPSGFQRELETNESQKKDSQYARDFQKEGAHLALTAEGLAGWVAPDARSEYVAAFRRSDFEAMLNYYKASYPRTSAPAEAQAARRKTTWPKIRCSVLVLHGIQDTALHAEGHAGTWRWVDADTTLMMIPGAGHFVQHDAAELVTQTIASWLLR